MVHEVKWGKEKMKKKGIKRKIVIRYDAEQSFSSQNTLSHTYSFIHNSRGLEGING